MFLAPHCTQASLRRTARAGRSSVASRSRPCATSASAASPSSTPSSMSCASSSLTPSSSSVSSVLRSFRSTNRGFEDLRNRLAVQLLTDYCTVRSRVRTAAMSTRSNLCYVRLAMWLARFCSASGCAEWTPSSTHWRARSWRTSSHALTCSRSSVPGMSACCQLAPFLDIIDGNLQILILI